MSYCYDVHHLITQMLKGQKPLEEELEFISSEISIEEFESALRFIVNLKNEKTIEELIDCAGFDTETFCETFAISSHTLERWKNEGPTDFELDALIFYIVHQEIEVDRYLKKSYEAYLSAITTTEEDT